jgi:hypothetical protein
MKATAPTTTTTTTTTPTTEMKTTRSKLIIIFDSFNDGVRHRYKEIISDAASGEFIEERDLARKPRASRFDAVYENGAGDHNPWNAHRATRLHGHRLIRK